MMNKMDSSIGKQETIDHLQSVIDATNKNSEYNEGFIDGLDFCINHISTMPSAQPVSKELIARIREWINSDNRGTADYFIVDKIEEIINEYERLN